MNEFEAWQKIIEKWKEVDRMKTLNQRLYDELGGSLMYILEYAERNNITLPNKERLWKMVDNIHDTVDVIKNHHDKINRYKFSPTESKHSTSLPTEFQQRNKTTDDSTEPKRPMEKGEVIHHIDGNPQNNEITNLQLLSNQSEHMAMTMKKNLSGRKCSNCGTTETQINNGKYISWYDDGKGGFLCRSCYYKKNYNYVKKKKNK